MNYRDVSLFCRRVSAAVEKFNIASKTRNFLLLKHKKIFVRL